MLMYVRSSSTAAAHARPAVDVLTTTAGRGSRNNTLGDRLPHHPLACTKGPATSSGVLPATQPSHCHQHTLVECLLLLAHAQQRRWSSPPAPSQPPTLSTGCGLLARALRPPLLAHPSAHPPRAPPPPRGVIHRRPRGLCCRMRCLLLACAVCAGSLHGERGEPAGSGPGMAGARRACGSRSGGGWIGLERQRGRGGGACMSSMQWLQG